jgi:hypothetical protein
MKKIFFLLSMITSVYSFGQFPPEFPKKLLNKVYCGNITVYAKKYMSSEIDFSMNTNFDYKIYISESQGIYVEYNPGQKFGKDKSGKTEIVNSFPLWTKEPYVHKDKYGDVTGKTTSYKFKVYPDTKKDHHIKEISLTIYEDGFKFDNGEIAKEYSRLYLTVNVPYHQDAQITLSSDKIECERLKTKAEIEKEEQERIKLENLKKEADKSTLQKINDLINKNLIEDAAIEYSNLKHNNSEIKKTIQNRLEDKYKDSVLNLKHDQIESYIQNYLNSKKRAENETRRKNERTGENWKLALSSLGALEPGEYNVKFDKLGKPNNKDMNFKSEQAYFENLYPPAELTFGTFKLQLNSKAVFKIQEKDSIFVNSIYSTSITKPVFIDKNENFYFKTKRGLPTATVIYDFKIPNKMMKIDKTFKKEKYANGILIHSFEYKTEKTVGIMKKD